ncbi:hypothetical protein RHS01_04161 [Rhizoctonia solani]|uniref:Uncharacterized protein n=1 Tax=Rhizoctonia solani TaxID=456999 RepID=A0A8H7IGQ9_9AGAM|nr:hypothetical protein RHS01_04161 [Rhizoctonia solani]
MKEFSCDAKTTHKVQRSRDAEGQQALQGGHVATKTAFNQYWNDARKSICLALFGSDALQLNVVDEKKSQVAKAICYCLFENDVRLLKRAVERSRTTEEELKRAYQDPVHHGNARHMYRLLKSLLRVQRVCGIDILTDQNPWKDWIEKMLKERVVKVKATVAIVPDEVMDRMMDEYAEMLREQQAKIIKDETQDPSGRPTMPQTPRMTLSCGIRASARTQESSDGEERRLRNALSSTTGLPRSVTGWTPAPTIALSFAGSKPNWLKFVESPGFTAAIAKHPSQTIVLAHNSVICHSQGSPLRLANPAIVTPASPPELSPTSPTRPSSIELAALHCQGSSQSTTTWLYLTCAGLPQSQRSYPHEVYQRNSRRAAQGVEGGQQARGVRAFLRHLNRHDSTAGSDRRDEKLSMRAENFILSCKGPYSLSARFWTSRGVMNDLLPPTQDVLIRRDERSRMPDGQPLLPLVAKHTVISWLKLGEKTTSALSKQTSTDEQIDQGRTDLQGFFTRIKQILVHPDLEILLDDIERARRDKEAEKASRATKALLPSGRPTWIVSEPTQMFCRAPLPHAQSVYQ